MTPPRSKAISIEHRVERLEDSVSKLHDDYREIAGTLGRHGETLDGLSETMGSINAQLAELVRLGERQLAQREAIDRAFSQIGKLEERASGVERQVLALAADGTVVKAVGGGVGQVIVRAASIGIVAGVTAIIAVIGARAAL